MANNTAPKQLPISKLLRARQDDLAGIVTNTPTGYRYGAKDATEEAELDAAWDRYAAALGTVSHY